MPRIGAAIAVENDPAFLHAILVGPLAPLHDRSGGDRERHVGQDRRLEDALRPDEGHSRVVEGEAPAQGLPREGLAVEARLLREERERRRADAAVQVGGRHGWKINRAGIELKGHDATGAHVRGQGAQRVPSRGGRSRPSLNKNLRLALHLAWRRTCSSF